MPRLLPIADRPEKAGGRRVASAPVVRPSWSATRCGTRHIDRRVLRGYSAPWSGRAGWALAPYAAMATRIALAMVSPKNTDTDSSPGPLAQLNPLKLPLQCAPLSFGYAERCRWRWSARKQERGLLTCMPVVQRPTECNIDCNKCPRFPRYVRLG